MIGLVNWKSSLGTIYDVVGDANSYPSVVNLLDIMLFNRGEQMPKLLTMLFGLGCLLSVVATASAESNHTPEQAKALVQKAAEYLKREGKEKALPVFSDPNGEFVDGDLYLFVMDAVDGKLTMLAHGVNKALIGKPQIDVRDANGKAFNQETIAALSAANEFWLTYAWPNPMTKKIAQKKSFLMKVGDVIIGAGVYN
jgi:cytochrome c